MGKKNKIKKFNSSIVEEDLEESVNEATEESLSEEDGDIQAEAVGGGEIVPLEERAKGKKIKADTVVEEQKPVVEDKAVVSKKKKAKKAKKEKKGVGRKIKEIFSEIKKVQWPKFGKVVKTTGLVLVVTLFFLVIVGLSDLGLSALLGLIK